MPRTLAFLVFVLAASPVAAQFGPPPPEPPGTPKQKQRLDITGWWVSVVHEDWRFRMVTAPKGDTVNVPLNPVGKKLADSSRKRPGSSRGSGSATSWPR